MSTATVLLATAAGVVAASLVRRLGIMVDAQRQDDPVVVDRHRRRPPGRTAAVSLLVVVATVVGWGAAIATAACLAGGWVAQRRGRERRRRAERDVAVPDLVDLFSLAASAGLPVATALPVVAERSPPAVRSAMKAASAHLTLGGSTAKALHRLRGSLGPRAEPLLDALDVAARTGTPLRPALAAVAVAAHHQRASAAEEAARRLPVTLLFPLACCILPAAVLLALAPVLVVSLGSLSG